MLALLSALIVAQAPQPSVAVVLSRRSAVPAARASKLLSALEVQLEQASVVALSPAETSARLGKLSLKDATFCGGKKVCLAELGRQLPADVVVGLSLVFVKPDLSVAVTAVNAADGAVLAEKAFVLAGNSSEGSFDEFANALKVALTPAVVPEVKRSDPPPDAPIADVSKPPPSITPVPPPEFVARSPVPAIVTGGATVVALGVGVGLLASALGKNASLTANTTMLPDGRLQSPLTDTQAVATRDAANAELGASIGCAVGAAALGVVTLVLWPRSP